MATTARRSMEAWTPTAGRTMRPHRRHRPDARRSGVPRERRGLPGTDRLVGDSARSSRSGSRAPARTAPVWPASGRAARKGGGGRPSRPPGSPPQGQVGSARRGRGPRARSPARPPGRRRPGPGPVEAIRAMRVARRGAVKARTAAFNQFHGLLVMLPETLREALTGMGGTPDERCAAFRVDETGWTIRDRHQSRATSDRAPHQGADRGNRLADRRLKKLLTRHTAPHHSAIRRRYRGRRPAARLSRRQPRTAAQRGRVCALVRGRPDPGQLRSHRPAPAQPGW